MTMFEWIKQASYEDMKWFIWNVYHSGNYDGRNLGEDSPPNGLPSFFGGGILQKTPEECAKAFEDSYDCNADFLVPDREYIEIYREAIHETALIDLVEASATIKQLMAERNNISEVGKNLCNKLDRIVNILKEEK